MKSGGYTQPTSKALNAFDGSKATNSEFSFDELISTMKRINEVLENPPASAAILDYDYFEKESDFMDKIKDNAKG